MKMKQLPARQLELCILFIAFPILIGIRSIPLHLRLSFAPFVTAYVVYISYRERNSLFKKRKQVLPHQFWNKISIRWLFIAIATLAYVTIVDKSLLFKALLTQPLLWIQMLLVYTFLSVVPQEFVYRVFYFKRYRHLFKSQQSFFVTNALVFSLGHLMFQNILVLIITFIGGYIFAYTYHKTKSLFWVCVEHLIYGGWLFTVGMGKMLGFPI